MFPPAIPDDGQWFQQFFFEFEPSMVKDLNGRTLSWQVFTAPFNAESNSGVHLEANYAPEFERLVRSASGRIVQRIEALELGNDPA